MSGQVRWTRLAPSPTGALHLGHARSFVLTWALARRWGWRILLRIEDLAGPRVRPEHADAVIRTLQWLGLDWDAGPAYQSADLEPYRAAMRALACAGQVYPCRLTRREVEAAAEAPQDGVHEIRYPAALRPSVIPRQFDRDDTNWRLIVPDETVEFEDGLAGRQAHRPAATVGDFVVWTRARQPAYQLAVVVDDQRQGVTDIVRGDDLLDSTARQLLVRRALGMHTTLRYWHLPLVRGEDGRRLAKRHGDTRIDAYRQAGVSAERIIGLVGWWSGVGGPAGRPEPMTARELCARLDPDKIPREAVVFRQEQQQWLMARDGPGRP